MAYRIPIFHWHIPSPSCPESELDWGNPDDRNDMRSWIVIREMLRTGQIEEFQEKPQMRIPRVHV